MKGPHALFLAWAIGIGPWAAGAASNPEYLPEIRTVNGIAYLSGGIGRDERRALRQAARQFDLQITFLAHNGKFLADVRIAVDDAAGHRLLETTSDGPIILLALPAGHYTVSAVSDEHLMTRAVEVHGDSPAKLTFRWPSRQ